MDERLQIADQVKRAAKTVRRSKRAMLADLRNYHRQTVCLLTEIRDLLAKISQRGGVE